MCVFGCWYRQYAPYPHSIYPQARTAARAFLESTPTRLKIAANMSGTLKRSPSQKQRKAAPEKSWSVSPYSVRRCAQLSDTPTCKPLLEDTYHVVLFSVDLVLVQRDQTSG